jgi:hypothetical protein
LAMARAPGANLDVFMLHQRVKSAWEQSSSFNQSSKLCGLSPFMALMLCVVSLADTRDLLLTLVTHKSQGCFISSRFCKEQPSK